MNPLLSSSPSSPRRASSSLSTSLFGFYFTLTLALFITLSSAQTYEGCYAIDNNLVLNDTNIFQSKGRCEGTICGPQNYAFFGMSGDQCYCGNSLPSLQVAPDHCNMQCPGFPNDTCGGTGYFSVYLSGVGQPVGGVATTILSNAPSATSSSLPSSTVVVTASPTTVTQSASHAGKSGGGISGGAAAGIVIAILLIVGGGAGAFFYIRRRRLEYQRQSQSSNMGSLTGSGRYPYGTDQRLDPGMVQKRESVGSLADERDYTRKILRVTNPDRI